MSSPIQYTEKLPVPLTEEEMAKLAEELGALETELITIKDLKYEASKEFNNRIKDLEEKIAYKAQVAVSGREIRDVPCVWEPDYESARKRLIRQDSFDEVRNEKLKPEEMQGALPL